MRRSREVVPEELVAFMSLDSNAFLSCLVMIGEGCGRRGYCGLTLSVELVKGEFVRDI